MDPLTHTLVGANLAATRLAEKTRLAAPALILGANAPDIDAITYFMDQDLALGFRRGWTHGVLALVVLPFALTGLLMLWDRIRPDPARPVRPRWLLLLSTIAVVTHPALDWLNTYGMRWLMPFRPRWFYGDSVYIMDPWLWLILGFGWLAGRRPSIGSFALWLFFSLAIFRVVGRRSPEYLIVVGIVAAVLLGALLWRGASGRPHLVHRFAAVALGVAALYIGTRLAVRAITAGEVATQLRASNLGPIARLMLSPHPLDPTSWGFVAQVGDTYRFGKYVWGRSGFELRTDTLSVAGPSPEYEAARRDPSVWGFMTWVRFPAYEVEKTARKVRVYLYDARRGARGPLSRSGARVVTLP